MKQLIIFFLLLLTTKISFSQMKQNDTLPTNVKTIGLFDMREAKSGYRINNYYVDLTPIQVKKFKGKKVEVTGKLIIVKGLDPKEKEYTQGSKDEREFIKNPKIKILKN